MKILYGLKDGAVLQRDKNEKCKCIFAAKTKGEIRTDVGKIENLDDGKYLLVGIETGGPYSITVSDDEGSVSFKDIYVGDIWLLGGQSNMEGAGVVTEKDEYYGTHTNENIRAFYMEDEWRPAVPLLHRLWKSKDAYIADEWKNYRKDSPWKDYDKEDVEYPYEEHRGVGPGFAFALKMHEITGVPQGVIPCGIGGSSLESWAPDSEKKNYYSSMIRRLKECGGNARGLYWDQGEAECFYAGVEQYNGKMNNLIEHIRRENLGDLAVVFDQIAYNELWNESKDGNICWSAIREKQRLLPDIIQDSDTVSTINAGLSDLIHKDSYSQYEIGNAAAMSMANLCGYGGASSIKFKGFKIVQSDTVPFRYDLEVYYENVIGELKTFGMPRGFSIQLNGEETWFYPYKHIQNIESTGNKVKIRNELKYDELLNADIWYGIGNNCVCTISDGGNRYLPAMGPIKVKDNLINE